LDLLLQRKSEKVLERKKDRRRGNYRVVMLAHFTHVPILGGKRACWEEMGGLWGKNGQEVDQRVGPAFSRGQTRHRPASDM